MLVVEGFGSTCCHGASALRAGEPNLLVRQFSYLGLDAAGQPIPYSLAGNLSIQVLGDRMAAQVEELHRLAGTPVDIVAESEGTLGLYAMLARHPEVPVRSVVLLSPIVEPGQLGQAADTVPGAALTTLNNLVGGMSPYGRSGAQALINSVSEVGASYFAAVSHDRGVPWLAVVPLADAVTLPACPGRRTWSSSTPSTVACSATARCSGSSRRSWPAAHRRTRIWTTWRAVPSGTCAARPSSSRPRPPPGGCRTCTRLAPARERPARWRDRAAVRYAMSRDENSPPAVVAPPLGGVLIRV